MKSFNSILKFLLVWGIIILFILIIGNSKNKIYTLKRRYIDGDDSNNRKHTIIKEKKLFSSYYERRELFKEDIIDNRDKLYIDLYNTNEEVFTTIKVN